MGDPLLPHDNVLQCDNLTTNEMVALAAAMEWSRGGHSAVLPGADFGAQFATVYLAALRQLEGERGGRGITSA